MEKIKLYGKDYDICDEIICDCGCIFIKDNCDVGTSFSDKVLCEEHKPKLDLNKLEKEKIKELKEAASKEIYNVYPIWKQVDITNMINGYTQENKNDMISFITEKINYCNSKEEQIIQDIEALEV